MFQPQEISRRYAGVAQRLIQTATHSDVGFKRLSELCDRFGPRFSGSASLENAIDWTLRQMEQDGFARVHGEKVIVPRWIRGDESVELLQPRYRRLPMLGLGGSVATPPAGITAEVLVVESFQELKEKAEQAKNKIVVFDVPFTDYGRTVRYRTRGAIEAAKAGALASLIRSVGPFSMQTPHTGAMSYAAEIARIPHAAITLEDATLLHRLQKRGERPRIRIRMEAHSGPDGISRNVIAEIPGRELPNEIVVLSGHIDSWDVGQGAMDDGGGCLAAWEAARIIQTLGLRPRRTLRVVLWTNEENGMAGVRTYRRVHQTELARHVLALESDQGVFEPRALSFTGSEDAMPYLREITKLARPGEGLALGRGAAVSDLHHLIAAGVPVMGLEVEQRKYFWYHHTDADTLDKLDSGEFNRCVAAMAVMAYIVADMPVRLPRSGPLNP